jgi:Ca2+-binding EF-hand superfamily protein
VGVDASSLVRIGRGLLFLLALTSLALAPDAQGKKGGKKGGKGGGAPKAAGKRPGAGKPAPMIPGFDAPAGGAPKKPAGPQGKKPAAGKGAKGSGKKPAVASLDPMTEADRVAEEARARAELESADEKRLKELFQLCDLDQNGWISLREAELVLSFDRSEYRRADSDQDGRLVAREYSAQKTLVFARLGAPPPPAAQEKPAPESAAAPQAPDELPTEPTPAKTRAAQKETRPGARARAAAQALPGVFPRPSDLLQRYDQDQSQSLGTEEVERLLVDLGLEFSAPLVVAQMDPDQSGALEPLELGPLSLLASRHMPESLKPTPPTASPAEVVATPEEPAKPAKRGSTLDAMTPFGRLDRDKDGFVGESDLAAMQGVARTDARLGALLSALDQDGDRKVSRAEFEQAMASPADGAR